MASIKEGHEIAESDLYYRVKQLERGGTQACPECYLAWTQGIDGDFRVAKEIRL